MPWLVGSFLLWVAIRGELRLYGYLALEPQHSASQKANSSQPQSWLDYLNPLNPHGLAAEAGQATNKVLTDPLGSLGSLGSNLMKDYAQYYYGRK